MNSRQLLAPVVGLILAGAAARAQGVLSYATQFPAAGLAATDWSQTLELPGFDSRLGTLTRVMLDYSGEVFQGVVAENTAGTATPYGLSSTSSLEVYNAKGTCLFDPGPIELNRTGTLAPFDGTLDFAGASGVSFAQDTRTTDSLNDPNLGAYIDAGMLQFLATATNVTTLSSGGDSVSGASSQAAVRLGITYAYTPIPEPTAYAAVVGLAALGWVVLRRRARAGATAGP